MAQTIGTSNKVDVWANDGTVVEPSSSKVDVGWQLGEQPPHEFMNYEQNLYGQKINHVLQHGVPRWNDETEYGVGDFVTHNDQLYRAINVNTNSEPPSGNWEALEIGSQSEHDSPSGVEKLARLDRLFASPFGRLSLLRIFTSSATYTPSTGVRAIIVDILGGGGAGGGSVGGGSEVSVGSGGGAGGEGEQANTYQWLVLRNRYDRLRWYWLGRRSRVFRGQ